MMSLFVGQIVWSFSCCLNRIFTRHSTLSILDNWPFIFISALNCVVGRAKFWNIEIFSHIFVSWGSTKRKSVVTSPIVQSWAPGTNLNIMLFCPVIGCLGCSALWLVQMVQQEIFPGAQLCTMGDVTTLFLFDEPQLTIIWLNITMFQNFARPNVYQYSCWPEPGQNWIHHKLIQLLNQMTLWDNQVGWWSTHISPPGLSFIIISNSFQFHQKYFPNKPATFNIIEFTPHLANYYLS